MRYVTSLKIEFRKYFFLELNLFKFTNLDLFIFNLDEFKCTNFHMLNILGFKI